jgi:HD-GYP domain-containing protein (c-di-GMP phosphodiesterase class II)
VFGCDAFNAMTTDRVYRKALSVDEALQELRDNSGTQFDPRVVSALVRVVLAGTTESTHMDGVRAILAHNQLAHDIGAPA